MTDFTALHEAVAKMTRDSANRQGILTLGGLRAALRLLPCDMPIRFSDGRVPGDVDSYRGYYERLAIDSRGTAPTVGAVVALLDSADGETFSGYKGGDYYMDSGTFVHAAEYGCCGEAIVGVAVENETAILRTAEEEW